MRRTTSLVAALGLTAATLTGALTAQVGTARADDTASPGSAHMGWHDTARASTTQAQDAAAATTKGTDVSNYQAGLDWNAEHSGGVQFAYIKATEGVSYTDPSFGYHYTKSYEAGIIRGAYHFALPNVSSGAAQANYFVDHGGGWSKDGKTLPGTLDFEFNPYGQTCFNMSGAQLTGWAQDFLNTYKQRTGVDAVIYTNANWFNDCVGDASPFVNSNPLWIAGGTTPATAGWPTWTIWQYTDTPHDYDTFNGGLDRVQALANG